MAQTNYSKANGTPIRRGGPAIGRRIRDVCALLEEIGPSGSLSLCDHIDDVEPSNMGKYCARAARQGLVTVSFGVRGRVKYSIYTVVPGWREIADMRMPIAKKPERHEPTRWRGVASVFQIGAQP